MCGLQRVCLFFFFIRMIVPFSVKFSWFILLEIVSAGITDVKSGLAPARLLKSSCLQGIPLHRLSFSSLSPVHSLWGVRIESPSFH